MTAIGGNKIGKVYLGSAEVSKMYLGSELVYQNVVVPPNYFAFTALQDGTFTLSIPAGITTSNLSYVEYSTDEGLSWVKTNNTDDTAVTITTPTITTGNRVLWRGSGIRLATSASVRSSFTATGNFDASGYINSLCYGDAVKTNTVHTYRFLGLFWGNTKIKSAEGVVFPTGGATQLCTSMFRGCSNLTSAPLLSATSANQNMYREMYHSCTKLKRVVSLATSSGSGCYYNWLYKVPSTCLLVVNYNVSSSQLSTINTNNLTYIYYRPSDGKYFLSDKTTECDKDGNVI